MDETWVSVIILAVLAVPILVVLGTRPPRCRVCGVPASDVEEYEVSPAPRVLAVAYRCPRCGELVARRPLGVPEP